MASIALFHPLATVHVTLLSRGHKKMLELSGLDCLTGLTALLPGSLQWRRTEQFYALGLISFHASRTALLGLCRHLMLGYDLCNPSPARAYPGDPLVIGLIFVVRQLGTPTFIPAPWTPVSAKAIRHGHSGFHSCITYRCSPKVLRTQSALPVGLYPSQIRQQTSDAAIRLGFHAPARRGACQQSRMRFACSRPADGGKISRLPESVCLLFRVETHSMPCEAQKWPFSAFRQKKMMDDSS